MLDMLNMGMLSLFLAILVLAVHVNARNVFVIKKIATLDPVSVDGPRSLDGLSPEFLCNSCLEVSREVEKVLADPKLLEKASSVSSEVCHVLPSDLRVKCLEMSETYIHQAVLFLQEYFREEKLCNSTGLCLVNTKTISVSSIWEKKPLSGLESVNDIMNKLWKRVSAEKEDSHQTDAQSGIPFNVHLQSLTDEVSDNKSCTACHNALDEILNDLDNPETKIKLLRVLLKACEKVDKHVKECKKLVFEYAPLVLANMEKFLTKNDLCSIVHICNGDALQTTEVTDV